YDRIDLHEAVGWLGRLSMQQKKWADRQASCGSPRRAWGEPRRFRGVVSHRERVTRTREQGVHSRNHAWAKRVATRALHWRCGGVMMDIPATATIGGHTWQWADLRGKIGYK